MLNARKVSTYLQMTDQTITDGLQDACIYLLGIDPTGLSDAEMQRLLDDKRNEFISAAVRRFKPIVSTTDLPSTHPLVTVKGLK